VLLAKKARQRDPQEAKDKGMAFLRDSAIDRCRRVYDAEGDQQVTFIEAGRIVKICHEASIEAAQLGENR